VRPIARRVIEKCREAAAQAAEALGESAPRIEVVERRALEPDKAELLAADAVIFGTTANFGYISGALKHYFDTLFYEVKEDTTGPSSAWWIRRGFDTAGAEKAIDAIITGLEWEVVADPVAFTGDPAEQQDQLDTMAEATVDALLTQGRGRGYFA